MELLRDFKNISKNDVPLAGGKGASLGEMTQAGISVPSGFVILANAFEKFLEETDLNVEIDAILDSVDHKEIHTIENASEKIQSLILQVKMPQDIATEIQKFFKNLNSKYVAVRSSATAEDSASAAWAGQLESYLNTTEENLLENVKKCWASLFTPRAIFYRFEKDLHKQKISVAVVVQKMVESEKSGIAFSVHPVTQDRNQLIIEAGFGLGEAIVSGQITPDSYVVEKQPRRIIDKNNQTQVRGLYRAQNGGNEWRDISNEQGEKQVLSDKEILELSETILKIENHYSFPCDIEWAFENGKFYIVQSRPITTLHDERIAKTDSIVMSKVYSREKTLFYFSMWNDSDRLGWKNFLEHDVKHNIFLIPPPGRKGSVWYSQKELDEIDSLLKQKIKSNPKIISDFQKTLDKNWKILLPYLSQSKKIENVDEFKKYYEHLVDWWSAMNTAFTIPDMSDIDEKTKKVFLDYRVESEKYTEKMNKVMIVFWNEHFPEFSEYTFCITPNEVEKISKNRDYITKLEERKNGLFMLDEKIYPLQRLNSLLEKNQLSLEEISTEGVEEIKGTSAYAGRTQGQVRKILSFADMSKFKNGEVLVTEMTNPDYLPIMKIASAVITDEGGATCHAAIASRELQIPCVVGTKISTHILQDGDIVDVDATSGVIKKLD